MTWSHVLDMLERQLHRQEIAFRGNGAVPRGLLFEPPATPMSPAEQIRAIALMQRHDQLITDTVAVMKRQRRETASPYSS